MDPRSDLGLDPHGVKRKAKFTVIAELERELLAAEHVLRTEYSFDLAEPRYRACLDLISKAAEQRHEMAELLIDMYTSKRIRSEPVAYLMHVLRWPVIQDWASQSLREDPTSIATGAGRANILAAYSDDWDNRDFYTF